MAKVPNGIETAENFNRLTRVHIAQTLQTDDRRQTDGRQHIANVNVAKNVSMQTRMLLYQNMYR